MNPHVIIAAVLALLMLISWIQQNTLALTASSIGTAYAILVLTGVAVPA